METAKFTRRTEDFDCIYCDTHVKGDGYTNHCPECLTSLHVDENPGDRASECHGLMLATSFFIKNGKEFILHKCTKCAHTRANRVSPNDNRDAIIALSSGTIEEYRKKLLNQKQQEALLRNKKGKSLSM